MLLVTDWFSIKFIFEKVLVSIFLPTLHEVWGQSDFQEEEVKLFMKLSTSSLRSSFSSHHILESDEKKYFSAPEPIYFGCEFSVWFRFQFLDGQGCDCRCCQEEFLQLHWAECWQNLQKKKCFLTLSHLAYCSALNLATSSKFLHFSGLVSEGKRPKPGAAYM